MEKMGGLSNLPKKCRDFGGFLAQKCIAFSGGGSYNRRENERRDSHDLPVYDENADDGSYCFHF